MASRKLELTDEQRSRVDRAREVAAADAKDLAEPRDFALGDAFINGVAFGVTREVMRQLLNVIDELTDGK